MRITLLLLIAFSLLSCNDKSEMLYDKLRNINELELIQVSLSKTYTIRDPYNEDVENGDFDLLNTIEHFVKKGERVGVYGLQRTYSAFINLNELSANDIQVSDNKISIVLPKIQIKVLGNEIVPKTYHERVSGLRFQISESERMAMRQKATEELDNQVNDKSSGVYVEMRNQAEQNAYAWFSSLLTDWGYESYISFKHDKDEAD